MTIEGYGIYYCASVVLGPNLFNGTSVWVQCDIGLSESDKCRQIWESEQIYLVDSSCYDISGVDGVVIVYYMTCTSFATAIVNAANYSLVALTITVALYFIIRIIFRGKSVFRVANWNEIVHQDEDPVSTDGEIVDISKKDATTVDVENTVQSAKVSKDLTSVHC